MLALADQLSRFSETELTADSLRALQSKIRGQWRNSKRVETDLGGLPVPPPRNQGLHPVGCTVHEAFLTFQFELGAAIEAGEGCFPARADFQVRVQGNLDLEGSLVQLEDHWRVDTDVYAAPRADQYKATAVRPPKEPHPLFHFQRGGHAQDRFTALDGFVPGRALPPRADDYWRALFQSPGPRMPALPMCPTLAIDFTIGQHDGLVWQRLRNLPEYRIIIERAQARLWEPLFSGLADRNFRRRWIGALLV